MNENEIFTSDEIYKICTAFLAAKLYETPLQDGEDILLADESELGKRVFDMDETQKKIFFQKVNATVEANLELYKSLPANTNLMLELDEHNSIMQKIQSQLDI